MAKTQAAPEPLQRFEITTRNTLGRETVHRHRATTADAAVEAMLDATGLDRERVVEVHRLDA
jgi:hypothetical protein